MIKKVLQCDKKVREYAEALHKESSLLVMGRGYNFATCLEGALVSSLILPFLPSKSNLESQRIDLHALRRHPCW